MPPSARASRSSARRCDAGPPGRFALMAAIAAVHAEAPSWDTTDWGEIVGLYDLLVQLWPSPVVALNRAVAVGLAEGPEAGLAALDALAAEPLLATYSYLASARADFLRRLGRTDEARARLRRSPPAQRERRRTGLFDRTVGSSGKLNGWPKSAGGEVLVKEMRGVAQPIAGLAHQE